MFNKIVGDIPFDNKIINLRLATQSQNMMNTKIRIDNSSGHKGISWSPKHFKWRAYINVNKKQIFLGNHDDIENAIKARNEAEIKYFGEFSRKKAT